jgi:hypothetical protein
LVSVGEKSGGDVCDSNLKYIFAKYMAKQLYIFNYTLLIKFAGKCSGLHPKITKGIIFY